jgi:type I restriction-modification system DNA methylase subunit
LDGSGGFTDALLGFQHSRAENGHELLVTIHRPLEGGQTLTVEFEIASRGAGRFGEPLVSRTPEEIKATDGIVGRRKRGTVKSAVLSTKSMEQMLWDAACSIRGEKDAPKFKDYILPLIFIKRLQTERKVSRPLKLYGQELTGSSYAIARMNMVIHDMEGEIVRGNSMTNPKFRESDTSLKKFEIIVANPMWNQPFEEKTFEKDPFDRFDSAGGNTSGKGDWAWLQHTITLLKDNGRAAVVLDTGAVTRGSGSKNEDKERNIRKWFVEKDLVDGVILLPENLFYNTTAAGIIIVLRRNKPKDRLGKITLVNASGEFKKGQPKNFIPQEGIKKIAEAFNTANDIDGFVKVITKAEAAKNDFNLSPSRYLAMGSSVKYRPLPTLMQELETLDKEAAKISRDISTMLRKITA